MAHELTRREAMKVAGAAVLLGGVLPAGVTAGPSAASSMPPPRTRSLRLAHLTDTHVQPERRATDGLIACLHHAQAQADPPQLILTGGDSIMDAFEATDARTKTQWDLWHRAFANECSLPVRSCIGNHDIWGINRTRSKTTGNEPDYGKKRAIDNLRLEQRFYRFSPEGSGWQIIVLDSTQPEGDGYRAFLDEEQFDWLRRELAAMPAESPVLVLSHIPIISASAILWSRQNEQRNYQISGSLIHQDAIAIKDLFARHRNVKLCLSGHLHLVDRVDYNGVTYLCNGAVSGNWWKGRHKDCDEGYAIIDLFNDGTFEHQYVRYGWTAAG